VLPRFTPLLQPPPGADFLTTHFSRSIEGVVPPLRDHLVAAEHLVPPADGFCL
jgi:hypothetical protein